MVLLPSKDNYQKHSNLISKVGLIFIVLFFKGISNRALSQPDEYLMKAVAMEQLSRFIEWPSEAWNANPTDPFKIVVLGNNPFGNSLEEAYEDHHIKNREVKITFIDNIEKLEECQILFVSSSEKKEIPKIVDSLKGKPVLSVGDTPGYAESGILANFFIVDNKLRFEINEKGMEDAGLNVSFLLIKVAKIVNPKED